MAWDDEALDFVRNQTLYSRQELRDKFGWEEYLVFALMLAVSAFIGIFYWWKGQKDNAEFLLGGKSMGVFPMTMSLIASFMSAITLLGTPAEVYQNGTQYCLLVLCYPFVMAATAYIYMPLLYDLGVSTSYEYLEWRFNKAVRVLGACCFMLQMVTYMAIVVYAPALAMSQLTGFDVDIACAAIFAICIFYTTIGGIKAVMWTDTFQAAVMFGSFLAIIIKGNHDAGGASIVFDRNYQSGRMEFFNFDLHLTTRHTVWTMVVGGYFTWVGTYGTNQTQIQRYLTVPDKSKVISAIWWNMLGIAFLLIMCAYAGLVVFAFYDIHQCDPIQADLVDKPDQLFPLFVMQVMGDIPCVPGLFVAGVFSGALSTVSSGMNSLAAVIIQDIVVGAMDKQISEKRKTLLTKVIALCCGLISYAVVFVVKFLPGVLEASLGLFGMAGGPILGAFTLGMFVPWANSLGTFVGMLTSLGFGVWMMLGQNLAKNYGTYQSGMSVKPTTIEGCPIDLFNETTTEAPEPSDSEFHHLDLYNVSYMWYAAIPCMMTITLGTVISFLYKPQDPKKLKPDLISPALPKLFSIWPTFTGVHQFFKELRIGAEYIIDEKYYRIKAQQIMEKSLESDEEKIS